MTACAPHFASATAASPVAMLPAMTSTFGKCFTMYFVISMMPLECPCAESTTTQSTPASASFSMRVRSPFPPETEADTLRRYLSSQLYVGFLFSTRRCTSVKL